MSIQANANGAARDLGIYAGINGAVKALFEDNILVENLIGTGYPEVEVQEDEQFDVGNYNCVVAVGVYTGSSTPKTVGIIAFPQYRMCLSFNTSNGPVFSDFSTNRVQVTPYSDRYIIYDPVANTMQVHTRKWARFFV